ncbi:pyridoxamine 5'-phosphate oxidase family protein [Chitinilyticum litopenaei]|uniref:pyridoxamine 5'-phosphate oxidase family protein n=1 Tax=Chitinilyticum litopenaei TaxID=1121276 RepID=UPI0003FB59AD|nr:pyridoxamine 5'-phosphate oxidase family protein [Chitinilyticum litopenaei]
MSTAPTPRTRIRRIPENAVYDRAALHAILDDGYLCHIAFADDSGAHCLPMAYWRSGEHLYIHGSNGSRLMKTLAGGAEVAIAISHLDGLVLARSAFNHSMNYRSAVIYGRFEAIADETGKAAALDEFMHKLAPGRQHEARPGSRQELGATIVLRIPLDEAAAKVRSGGPEDDEKDMDIPVWTGVLPYATVRATPQPAADCRIDAPDYVREWALGRDLVDSPL